MSRTTRFLKLFLPEDNDYYRVEEDQNENFEKIDKKLEEWDKGKEATIDKKTGFNLEKSDRYDYDNSSTLATSRALKLLYDFLLKKIRGIKLTWSAIEEKPSTFPPSTHNHDDRYYTETETDTKLNNLAGKKDGTFPLSNAMRGNVYYLPSTNKYYFCKEDYDSYQISVPNENFIEMSVYENLNRLNNLNKLQVKKVFNGSHTKKSFICELPSGWLACNIISDIWGNTYNKCTTTIFNTGASSIKYDVAYDVTGTEGSVEIRNNSLYLNGQSASKDFVIYEVYVLI